MHLLYSIYIFVGSFSMSLITTFFICYIYNYPVKRIIQSEEKQIEKVKEITLLLIQSFGIVYIFSDNIIPYREQYNIVESLASITNFCFFIEANYYVYHRFIHKYYYIQVHKKHHENIVVYPFDTFFLTGIDDCAFMFSLVFPSIFIKISMIEQMTILYVYITGSLISHSDIYWKHHYIHHKLPCYNYCLLFPFFDILFGTYKGNMETTIKK